MKHFILFLSLLSFTALGQADFEKNLQKRLILAEDGSTIEIEAGRFQLTKGLSLEGKKNITLRGKGIDKTTLSFKGQTQGAEGIRVSNCENIVIEDMTTEDSKGDLIDRFLYRDRCLGCGNICGTISTHHCSQL
jgi:hypothetical protein